MRVIFEMTDSDRYSRDVTGAEDLMKRMPGKVKYELKGVSKYEF